MKSFVSSLLLLAFLSSSISSVHGKESVAELRRLRASRGLGGWNGGDNGRDHPGRGQTMPTEEDANAAVAASTTTTGEATEVFEAETTVTTASEALAQDEDGTYGCNMSTAGKIALGVVGGLLAVGAIFWAMVYTAQDKKSGVHTAVPKTAADSTGSEEELEEATTASESSSTKQ